MAVLIPTTFPFKFRRGPPELPGLIAQSVWMQFRTTPCSVSGNVIIIRRRRREVSLTRISRFNADTTPVVTVVS